MFDAAAAVGGLSVQLVYFRGIGESRASPFVANARALRDLMVKIDCRGGQTQIGKVLAHVRREAEKRPVAALAYVGDAMEENPGPSLPARRRDRAPRRARLHVPRGEGRRWPSARFARSPG